MEAQQVENVVSEQQETEDRFRASFITYEEYKSLLSTDPLKIIEKAESAIQATKNEISELKAELETQSQYTGKCEM